MNGLSLEEINELFGEPVAVRITRNDKGEEAELEKRLQVYSVHGINQHVENSALEAGEKSPDMS
jgi:hypothetical protein